MDDLEDMIYVDCWMRDRYQPITNRQERDFDSRLLIPEFRRSVQRRKLSSDEIELPEAQVAIIKRNAKLAALNFVPGYTTKNGKKIKGYFRSFGK